MAQKNKSGYDRYRPEGSWNANKRDCRISVNIMSRIISRMNGSESAAQILRSGVQIHFRKGVCLVVISIEEHRILSLQRHNFCSH